MDGLEVCAQQDAVFFVEPAVQHLLDLPEHFVEYGAAVAPKLLHIDLVVDVAEFHEEGLDACGHSNLFLVFQVRLAVRRQNAKGQRVFPRAFWSVQN